MRLHWRRREGKCRIAWVVDGVDAVRLRVATVQVRTRVLRVSRNINFKLADCSSVYAMRVELSSAPSFWQIQFDFGRVSLHFTGDQFSIHDKALSRNRHECVLGPRRDWSVEPDRQTYVCSQCSGLLQLLPFFAEINQQCMLRCG